MAAAGKTSRMLVNLHQPDQEDWRSRAVNIWRFRPAEEMEEVVVAHIRRNRLAECHTEFGPLYWPFL